jgi:uncharacterized membrane protein YtjA (UPF0391 family)
VWAAVSLLISIIAAAVGFGGVAAGASWIPQTLFFVFMIVALVTLALGIRDLDH